LQCGVIMRCSRILTYILIFLLVSVYCYTKKIERNFHYGSLFYKLAQECGDRCTREKLKYYYKKAIYHDPNYSNAYYELAVLSEQDGNDEESLKLYRKVTQLDSTNGMAYFKIGIDHIDSGELEKAKRYLKQALKYNYPSGDYEAYYYLGRIYTMEKDYKTAIWYYKHNEDIEKEHILEIYLGLGVAYYGLGNRDEALKYVVKLRDVKRDYLAGQLEQFIEMGQYPEHLTRIELTK